MLVLDKQRQTFIKHPFWMLLACGTFFKTFLSHGVSALLLSLVSQSVCVTHYVILVIFQNFPIDVRRYFAVISFISMPRLLIKHELDE